jgi:hypothetical protein
MFSTNELEHQDSSAEVFPAAECMEPHGAIIREISAAKNKL